MNAKEFVSAADGIEIPEALDLTLDELAAIKAASNEPFDLISLGFKCGFMRGQSAATADVLHLMAQANERQLKLIVQFVRGLVKKDGVA